MKSLRLKNKFLVDSLREELRLRHKRSLLSTEYMHLLILMNSTLMHMQLYLLTLDYKQILVDKANR